MNYFYNQQSLINIMIFAPHNNSMRQVLLSQFFIDKEKIQERWEGWCKRFMRENEKG